MRYNHSAAFKQFIIGEPYRDVRRLEKQYGMEPGAYNKLWSFQNGLCAICDDVLVRPHLDHNHTTGKVRGILCQRCNLGIGLLKESITVLRQAEQYLTQHASDMV